jgi:long-chain fatty acid transport protein
MQIRRLAVAVLTTLVCASASAIGNFEPNAGLQFNFSNPGARSLGMGGAYLGFSDDATAAYTNPAGLTTLGSKEVFLEARRSGFDTPFVNGNSSGIFADRSKSNVASPSYFAFVYPGEEWALAFYRNEELDFENDFAKNEIQVPGGRIFASAHTIDAEIVNYGGSFAYKVNDQLSLGGSVVYSMLDLLSGSLRVRDEGGAGIFEVGDEESFTANIGLLYKFDERLSLGAAYRHGADFDIGVFALSPNGNISRQGTGEFNIPHQFSVGVAYRATEQLAIGFDAHYIDYSRLGDDPLAVRFENRNEFDSGTELRLGGEYVFATEVPFTLRAGVWHDPDHAFSFRGTPANFGQVVDQVLFPEGDDEIHYALGFGFAFERAQIDFGADFSDNVDTLSLSGALRF